MTYMKQFLQDFSAAWGSMNAELILAAVTDDFEFRMANCDEPIKGKAAFSGWLEKMNCAEGEASIKHYEVLIEGDRAAMTGEVHVQGKDGIERFAFCDVYQLQDEKIRALTAYCVRYGDGMKGCL